MWYFKSPEVVYGEDALSHLRQIEGERALIVTDATLQRLGVAARIAAELESVGIATRIFAEVEPEPSLQTVQRGAEVAHDFSPDWVIALGGGSPMDAAKAIWALYERPDLDATEINPMINLNLRKARMIAIPTTAGTGSEATWAMVLTDTEDRRKFSTGSRELVPTIAIVDPSLTQHLPAPITAATGLDALTHAIEGYVCTWRNDFTDPLCLKAAQLALDYLERACKDGANDQEAREKMGSAATLGGLGFGNANLGLAHAMGHSFGAWFKQPHGKCVALFLPLVMDFSIAGGVTRYADIVRYRDLVHRSEGACPGDETQYLDELSASRLLAEQVRSLARAVGQPLRVCELGISSDDYEAAIEPLCDHAEMDTQFFTAPRIPDRAELETLFRSAY